MRGSIGILLALLLAPAPIRAHHSFAAAFDGPHGSGAQLPASLSAATAWLQLLTGEPSGHDDSGTLDLS